MICKPPSCRPPLLLSCEKARLDTQSPTLIDGKQLAAGFASSLCGGCQCFSIAVFYCGGAGASGRGRGADDDQQALRIIFEPGLNMNTVDPEIDVAFGREVALAPAGVLLRPGLLEAPNGRGRKPAGVLAKRGNQMHFP